jgi:hypothetical protein
MDLLMWPEFSLQKQEVRLRVIPNTSIEDKMDLSAKIFLPFLVVTLTDILCKFMFPQQFVLMN